jgi:protein O-GlcNAc transferase
MRAFTPPYRRRAIAAAATLVFLVIFLDLRAVRNHGTSLGFLPTIHALSPQSSFSSEKPHREQAQHNLELPLDYVETAEESSFCAERFSTPYLENLRRSATGYCTHDSPSNLTCFHSRTAGSRLDSFCFLPRAAFDTDRKQYNISCQPRSLTADDYSRGAPELEVLPSYWYETGPRVIFDQFIHLDDRFEPPLPTKNYTILMKREDAQNLWHSLMEIFSLSMTLDVLQMTPESHNGRALLSKDDAENTQVVILDNHEDGPFFDLWRLFARKPTIRLNEIPKGAGMENVIIPLAGGSNTMWQGDWEPHSCQTSPLLRTFLRRILSFYDLNGPPVQTRSNNITITFVDRKKSRHLINHEAYLEELERKFEHVSVQAVDFASIPLKQQIQVAQQTDILVGVHGAGLTHGMFLPPRSAIVEILPGELQHKGFRNLAGLLGHSYCSVHGPKREQNSSHLATPTDWHSEDVFIEKDRFINLMDVAIKGLYNKGLRTYDIN